MLKGVTSLGGLGYPLIYTSSNKGIIQCIIPKASYTGFSNRFYQGIIGMQTNGGFLAFMIPLPTVITDGVTTWNLKIDYVYYSITDADINDFVDNIEVRGYTAPLVYTQLAVDATNRTAPIDLSWDLGGTIALETYEYGLVVIDVSWNTALELDFSLPRVRFWYAEV